MYFDYVSLTFRLSTPSCFIVIIILAQKDTVIDTLSILNMHERYGIEKISRIRKCKGKGLEIWCIVTGGS